MAWAAPVIHAVGDVLTASDWNISSRDLSFVAGAAFGAVLANESTASTTYTNLATTGPSVTVTTGTSAIVSIGAYEYGSTTNSVYSSYAVSGASTVAAADAWSYESAPIGGGIPEQASFLSYQNGLTPGSNTFTAKYRVNAGTGNFANRYLIVWPLP